MTKALSERDAIKQGFTSNSNGSISVNAYAKIELNSQVTNLAVMGMRGYPDGMAMDLNESACEKLSPGIVKAQANARGTLIIPCIVTIDKDGNRTVELTKPK
jgi:hypothetical protein